MHCFCGAHSFLTRVPGNCFAILSGTWQGHRRCLSKKLLRTPNPGEKNSPLFTASYRLSLPSSRHIPPHAAARWPRRLAAAVCPCGHSGSCGRALLTHLIISLIPSAQTSSLPPLFKPKRLSESAHHYIVTHLTLCR